MAKHTLIDADAMKSHYRATFMIPTAQERASIRAGDHVKVGFIVDESNGRNERIWLKVSTVHGQRIRGVLENEPLYVNARAGDDLRVELRHVLAIERANACSAVS
jgi:uncharacterized protein YegJ (DUF2314 family)